MNHSYGQEFATNHQGLVGKIMINSKILFKMIRTRGVLLLVLSFLLNATAMAGPNSRSPFGINSNEVMDDDASIPFIDIFKTSLPFEEARPWLTKGKIVYDKDGWPKNLNGGQVGTRFLYKLPRHTVPEGNYTVLYDGEGILTYSDDAKLIHREKGKDIIRITAGKDKEYRVKLIIKHSNPANYLRNIRVLLPGGICANNPFKRVNSARQCRSRYLSFEDHHKNLIFNPDYLNYMKDFKVIRFMNMSGITRNPLSTWDKRPKVNNATWAGKQGVRGAPIEIMVALANKLNADPWFNMPHKANNDFIRRYAQYVKNNLKPGLKAYVEYTNEAWNTIFTQAHYVKDQGERLGLDEDRDKGGYKYFSLRSVQIFDMWEQTFGGTDRLVRVMGSWVAWTRSSEMLLSYRNAYKKTDAIAIAPYFQPNFDSAKKARSVAQLFQLIYNPKQKHSIPKVLGYIHKNAEMAKKFGVDMIAYEGGQHFVDWKSRNVNSHPTKLMIAANRNWRMAKAYSDFMRGWKNNGGKLFVNFSAPRTYQWFGSWGTKEYITQPISEAPKHRAILQFSRSNPCWWPSCSSPIIARWQKPEHNPVGDVFALVKSKPRKNKRKLPAKTQIARNTKKPKATTVARVTPKRAPAKKQQIVKAVIKKAPVKKIAKAVIASSRNNTARPIWAAPNGSPSKASVKTNKANKRPQIAKKKPNSNTPYNAVAHRVKGRGRFWSNSASIRLANIIDGRIRNGRDLSAVWQAHWDNKFLHLRVDTIDDKFVRDSRAPWGDDSVEIYIDADGSRSAKFDGKNDFHLIYRWKDKNVNLSKNSPHKANLGIRQTMTRTNKGYTLETSIPWSTLGVRPVAGNTIGIDIQINDDDSGHERDGKLAWFSKNDNAWKNPRNFGRVKLGI